MVPIDQDSISEILEVLAYTFRPKSLFNPPVSTYVKEIEDQEIEIEFLTDNRSGEKDKTVPIPRAEVTAQPLSYLEMSLNSTAVAILPGNTEIRVVFPEAWVFHKGLTFVRRRSNSTKQYKDLYGL